MSFGGAGPGMAILMGVAQGVARADKRKREMEQEAIRKALWARQIEESQERMELSRQQEERYRENAAAEAKLRIQQEENKRIERQQELAHRREMLDNVQGEILRETPDQDPAIAYQQAEMVLDKAVPWSQFQAEDPEDQLPPGGIAGARWQHQLEQERILQAGLDRLYDSPAAMTLVGEAKTLTDAILAGQSFQIPEVAVREYWNAGGKGRLEKDDPTVLEYADMTGGQQKGVDRLATEFVNDAWTWAERYRADNPQTTVPLDELAYNFIMTQRAKAEVAHSQGEIDLDDFRLAAFKQADFIFQQSLEEREDEFIVPPGAKSFR